jgi:transposase
MMGRRRPRQERFELTVVAPPETSRRALLRQLDEQVDWSFLYAQAEGHFSERTGRPSIDPVVMVKMMLVGYLLGIEGDRGLVEHCADSLSVREFLGYDLDEALPVHASFTHWRQRLGPDFFREVLHQIVDQCVAAGLKLTTARAVDATFMKAQASKHGPRLEVPQGEPVEEYLESYFAGEVESADREQEPTTSLNLNDPDARLQQKRSAERVDL